MRCEESIERSLCCCSSLAEAVEFVEASPGTSPISPLLKRPIVNQIALGSQMHIHGKRMRDYTYFVAFPPTVCASPMPGSPTAGSAPKANPATPCARRERTKGFRAAVALTGHIYQSPKTYRYVTRCRASRE